jgi:hypothetical protein
MVDLLRARKFTALLLAFAVCALLAGCTVKKETKDNKEAKAGGDTKLTSENFAKVKNGMAEKDVVDLLGEPTERKDADSGKGKHLIWKSGASFAQVDFKDGKVEGKTGAIVNVKVN